MGLYLLEVVVYSVVKHRYNIVIVSETKLKLLFYGNQLNELYLCFYGKKDGLHISGKKMKIL